MSFAYTRANTELNIGSRAAYVTYPGMTDLKPDATVTLKLFREHDGKEVHKYVVPPSDWQKAQTFRFALEDAEKGNYHAQLCYKSDANIGEDCSEKSSPASPIETGVQEDGSEYKLTCLRILSDTYEESLEANLKSVSGWADETVIGNLVNNDKSVAHKHGFSENKEIRKVNGKDMVYFVILYPAKEMREFMRKEDSCKRKYAPVIITYVVEKVTKRVIKKQRLVPYMPVIYYREYLGLDTSNPDQYGQYPHTQDQLSDIKPVPIELLVDAESIVKPNDYEVWHTACVVLNIPAKEEVVRCSAPFIGQWQPQS